MKEFHCLNKQSNIKMKCCLGAGQLYLYSDYFLQPVMRIYDIPDDTFESEDDDDDEDDEDDDEDDEESSDDDGMYFR